MLCNDFLLYDRVPTLTGKPEKNGKAFSSQGKVRELYRLEKSGKMTQNTGKLKEFEINII